MIALPETERVTPMTYTARAHNSKQLSPARPQNQAATRAVAAILHLHNTQKTPTHGSLQLPNRQNVQLRTLGSPSAFHVPPRRGSAHDGPVSEALAGRHRWRHRWFHCPGS
jgi:hypothetical protein